MPKIAKLGAILIGATMLPACATAQGTAPAETAIARADGYAELEQLPNWGGIWYPDWGALFAGRDAAAPQLTPAAQAKFDAYNESIKANGPNQEAQAQCLPPGVPGVMQQPYPIELLFTPGRVTLLTEAYEQVRRIYTDGRALPEEPDLFFNGNSIGHWEGDTLVVESVGFHLSTNIAAGIGHSEQMRIDERIYLESPELLIDEMTITDPETLTEPFVVRIAFKPDNDYPMREYVCAENNRLQSGEHGANIDLGLEEDDSPFDDLDDEGSFGPSD